MSTIKTQSSSKPRLKNDTLGNDALTKLYRAYETMSIDEFRELAAKMVQSGGGKQAMKDKIISDFGTADKARILRCVVLMRLLTFLARERTVGYFN